MKLKKILVISHNFWPENFPINTFVESIKDKYEITVLTGKPNYPLGSFFPNYKFYGYANQIYLKNIKIIRVPTIPRGDGSFFNKFLNYFSFIFFSLIYLPKLLKNNFDYIFIYGTAPVVHSIIGIFIKKIKKIKLYLWLQDLLDASYEVALTKNKYVNFLLKKILNYIYLQSDLIFIQSFLYKKMLQKVVKNKSLIYLPNPINQNLNKIRLKNNSHEINKNNFNIFYFGNIGLVQEFQTIVKASKILSNKKINFHFFGEGLMKKKLKILIKIEKITNFYIHDYIDYQKIKNIISKKSILFLSLKKNRVLNLTMPSKLQLYLYLKKPIIAEISGETSRVLKASSAGFVIPHGNVNIMVKKILYLYNLNNESFLRFGINGKRYFNKNFTKKAVRKIFINSINKN